MYIYIYIYINKQILRDICNHQNEAYIYSYFLSVKFNKNLFLN